MPKQRVTNKLELQRVIRSMQMNNIVPPSEWFVIEANFPKEQIVEIYESVHRVTRGQELSKRIRAKLKQREDAKLAAHAGFSNVPFIYDTIVRGS